MPRQAGGIARIKSIYSSRNTTEDVFLVSDAQEVPRFVPPAVLVEEGHHPTQEVSQFLPVLPKAAPNGIPVEG
eukprot:CAMPEP_0113533074 /NCGR_PEP_ID=MMETSP0015_2-20120614/4402_1 /TAXON_ID=2838 /ORGANISM="Odontella" /LENGTH=72 /DNA_ID=CAMNT_0000432085 /DNA_START=388 /DNA_END=606 /DNA_ORIENTATION=- /assembly_acc=CAM_ASM_000160